MCHAALGRSVLALSLQMSGDIARSSRQNIQCCDHGGGGLLPKHPARPAAKSEKLDMPCWPYDTFARSGPPTNSSWPQLLIHPA